MLWDETHSLIWLICCLNIICSNIVIVLNDETVLSVSKLEQTNVLLATVKHIWFGHNEC